MNPDYPVCCPDTDHYTNWCGATADGCPSSLKKLPKMAANKKIQKPTKQLADGCDGKDCRNNWCCNESDYPICCPIGDDGIQWCANSADDCPPTYTTTTKPPPTPTAARS